MSDQAASPALLWLGSCNAGKVNKGGSQAKNVTKTLAVPGPSRVSSIVITPNDDGHVEIAYFLRHGSSHGSHGMHV